MLPGGVPNQPKMDARKMDKIERDCTLFLLVEHKKHTFEKEIFKDIYLALKAKIDANNKEQNQIILILIYLMYFQPKKFKKPISFTRYI